MATADSTLALSRNVLIRPLIAPSLSLEKKLVWRSNSAKKLVMPNAVRVAEDTLRPRLAKAVQPPDGRASRRRFVPLGGVETHAALDDQPECQGIELVLLLEHARGKRVRRVSIEHGHDGLRDD